VPLSADHDVIAHRNTEGLQGFRKNLGHRYIGLRGRRIACRVIMDGNDGSGADFQGAPRNLAGINGGVVNGSGLVNFVCKQAIPFAEKQQPELLGGLERHPSAQVIQVIEDR
jgi:hypothetical protein